MAKNSKLKSKKLFKLKNKFSKAHAKVLKFLGDNYDYLESDKELKRKKAEVEMALNGFSATLYFKAEGLRDREQAARTIKALEKPLHPKQDVHGKSPI